MAKIIRDPAVISLVGRLAEHYQTNITSRFIRPVLLQLGLEKSVWDLIDALTAKHDHYQEYVLEELYQQLAAAAKLAAWIRRDIVPNIRNRVESAPSNSQEKIIRDMAVSAFPANLNVFANYLKQLYELLVKIDQADTANGRKPLSGRMTELIDVKRNLGFDSPA